MQTLVFSTFDTQSRREYENKKVKKPTGLRSEVIAPSKGYEEDLVEHERSDEFVYGAVMYIHPSSAEKKIVLLL